MENKILTYSIPVDNDAVMINGVLHTVSKEVCELIIMISAERDAYRNHVESLTKLRSN